MLLSFLPDARSGTVYQTMVRWLKGWRGGHGDITFPDKIYNEHVFVCLGGILECYLIPATHNSTVTIGGNYVATQVWGGGGVSGPFFPFRAFHL